MVHCYVIVALSLVALCHVTSPVEACSCIFPHPQTAYCNADYVIRAKITSKSAWNGNGFKYGVSVLYKYKHKYVYDQTNNNYLYSNEPAAACGRVLTVGVTYLIMGHVYQGKAWVSSCDIILEWSDVTFQMKYQLNNYVYGRNCHCKIDICYTQPCSSGTSSTCVWRYDSPYSCYQYLDACVSYHGLCKWSVPLNCS